MANMKTIVGILVIMLVVLMGVITPSSAEDDDCTSRLKTIVLDCNLQNTAEEVATCCNEFNQAVTNDTACFCSSFVKTALANSFTVSPSDLFITCSTPGSYDTVCAGN